jgi:molecular chaperone GrpE
MKDKTKAQAKEAPAKDVPEPSVAPDQTAGETETGTCAENAGEAGAGPSPEERIAALEAQVQELNDQYLRKAADFENFRKRMNQEKQSAIDFANQSLLLDLIPMIDDLERAIKAGEGYVGNTAEAVKAFETLYEGITMTEKRLISQLENKWGLKRFDSAGEAFDPNRHEAIQMDKSPDIAEPVVHEDFMKGYTLKDRVVRCAKVKVLMPESPAETAGTEETATEQTAPDGDSEKIE